MVRVSRTVHRFFWLFGILSVVLVIVLAGSLFVIARAPSEPADDGTTATGAHDFWDKSNPEAEFCTQCHNLIATEMEATAAAGTHGAAFLLCRDCHGPGVDEHAAKPSQCVDCHSAQAGKLVVDAHGSMYADVGEDETDASWVCKACHTKVSIDLTSPEQGPLPLDMAPQTFPIVP